LCQKLSLGRPAGEQAIRGNASYDGGHALQNQQPPPTAESKPVDMVKNYTRKGSAEHACDRIGSTEQGNCIGQLPLAKPVSQVKQDSWDIPCLSYSKQKTQSI